MIPIAATLATSYASRAWCGGYPTEKPVGLWRTMIGQSTQPAEVVFDPFCGLGSVGVAAREIGWRAQLCDIDATTAATRLRVAVVALEGAAA